MDKVNYENLLNYGTVVTPSPVLDDAISVSIVNLVELVF